MDVELAATTRQKDYDRWDVSHEPSKRVRVLQCQQRPDSQYSIMPARQSTAPVGSRTIGQHIPNAPDWTNGAMCKVRNGEVCFHLDG